MNPLTNLGKDPKSSTNMGDINILVATVLGVGWRQRQTSHHARKLRTDADHCGQSDITIYC
eukprot:8081778-Ditylum_brightwellii.AAC.1